MDVGRRNRFGLTALRHSNLVQLKMDGSEFGFDFAGTYTKVVPNERIEYAFGDRNGLVEFVSGADGVKVAVVAAARGHGRGKPRRHYPQGFFL